MGSIFAPFAPPKGSLLAPFWRSKSIKKSIRNRTAPKVAPRSPQDRQVGKLPPVVEQEKRSKKREEKGQKTGEKREKRREERKEKEREGEKQRRKKTSSLNSFLGGPGCNFASFGELWGRSWGDLGCAGRPLGRLLGHLGRPWVDFCRFELAEVGQGGRT